MAASMAKQYQALPCVVDNDLDSAINTQQQPDWVSSWPNNHQQGNADALTSYLPCSIMSFLHLFERRKDSSHFWQGWTWLRSSFGLVLESTMALLVVPLSLILCYVGWQLGESLLPTIPSMASMMLCQDWRIHGSSSSTMTMPAITAPRMEGLVLLALTMVLVGGIGSFCSWMETEFLNNTTEQTLVPVWNLTIMVPPDMARNWVQYEKRMLHQIVSSIGAVE